MGAWPLCSLCTFYCSLPNPQLSQLCRTGVAVGVPAAEAVVLLQHRGELDDLVLDGAVGERLAGHARRERVVFAAEAGLVVEEALEVPYAVARLHPLFDAEVFAGAGVVHRRELLRLRR